MRRMWLVQDIDKVPRVYCQVLVDPDKVELALRNGHTIPGIKVWQDEEGEESECT